MDAVECVLELKDIQAVHKVLSYFASYEVRSYIDDTEAKDEHVVLVLLCLMQQLTMDLLQLTEWNTGAITIDWLKALVMVVIDDPVLRTNENYSKILDSIALQLKEFQLKIVGHSANSDFVQTIPAKTVHSIVSDIKMILYIVQSNSN